MEYKIIKKYEDPCQIIHPPVVKTDEEWLKVFPMLERADLDIKTDWFEKVDKHLIDDCVDFGELLTEPSKVDWDQRFLALTDYIAGWSKDRSTGVAAVIVDSDKRFVGMGYNGFPAGFDDDVDSRHERPVKYQYTEHAERNAIYTAARNGASVEGCTMYLGWFPCSDCARAIIQSGISKLVCCEPDFETPKWGPDFRISHEMLTECGVVLNYKCLE